MTTQTVTLDYQPFPLTQAFHWSPARFRVLSCGRRTGKTTAGIHELRRLLYEAWLTDRKPHRAWVVAPTYSLVKESFRVAQEQLRPLITKATESQELTLTTPFGTLEFKSAEREDEGLRGAGIACALIDEAARVSEKAWVYGVRPALADTQGRAVFLSTPKGRNWFYHLWRKGQRDLHDQPNTEYSDEYESWQCPSNARPSFPIVEWETIRRTTPELVFKQEWLAEFVEEVGEVFSFRACLRGALRGALHGRSYVAGLDIARTTDWLACVVIERQTKQVVGVMRSHHLTWSLQKAAAASFLDQFPRCHVLIDSTGVGDAIAEDLRTGGLDIEDFRFTAQSKQELVEQGVVALSQGLVGLPDQAETQWLLDELRDYTYVQSASGHIRYGAPEGKHDDGATALLLALWGSRFDRAQDADTLPQQPVADPDAWTMDKWDAYDDRVARFRRAYPTLSPPHHPSSYLWSAKPQWRRQAVR